jgi:hypothetical protein
MVKGLLVDRSSRVIVLDVVDWKVRLPQDAEDESHRGVAVPCREKPDKNPNCQSRKMMFKANLHFHLNMIQSQVPRTEHSREQAAWKQSAGNNESTSFTRS